MAASLQHDYSCFDVMSLTHSLLKQQHFSLHRFNDGPKRVTFYVQVDDIEAHLKKAEGMGAMIVLPVTTIPNMATFALCADPKGNVVGLLQSSSD